MFLCLLDLRFFLSCYKHEKECETTAVNTCFSMRLSSLMRRQSKTNRHTLALANAAFCWEEKYRQR